MPVDLVRDAAIDVLLRVFDHGMHLDESLDKTIRRRKLSDRGRRFMTQLCYGTVRHKALCDYLLRQICTQPLEHLPRPIHAILRMAMFQALFCDQVTQPAMVHTSVDLAKRRGHAGTARLVNAVLRRAPNSLDGLSLPEPEFEMPSFLATRFSTPRWLVNAWIEQYGESRAGALCAALNTEAQHALRVNTLKTTREALQAKLERAGVQAAPKTVIPEELTVLSGGAPTHTKLFRDGHYLIQDPASMLPAHLLEPQAGEWVLDLCAAPGGKTTHIAQLTGGKARVAAMDLHRWRLQRVRENIERLDLPGICLVNGDGARAPFAPVFDRVLVDAPCSGLGTVRRHPDLKWNLSSQALERLALEQAALLRSAIGLCKNGGLIVYSVCTFTPQETEEVTRAAVRDGGVRLEDGPEWLDPWKTATGQYLTLPFNEALDGFYLTRLRKVS